MALDEKVREEIEKRDIPSFLERNGRINPEKYRKFLLHNCKISFNTLKVAIVSGYKYTFSETSVATAVNASCPCGYEEDLTDYDSW